MYLRWAERHRFKTEIVDQQEGEQAGLKSATVAVDGRCAYGWLRAERGVHRLVRISPFDAQNRRQTTFALVEVLPEADDDVEIELDWDEIRVDTFRSQGAGGQHVNKTDSAVRLTHLPDGHRRPEPERALADPEQGDRDQGPQGAAARAGARGEGGGAAQAQGRARRGRLGQPDPELRPAPLPDGQGPPDRLRDRQHDGACSTATSTRSCRPSSSALATGGDDAATTRATPRDRGRSRPRGPRRAGLPARSAPTSCRPAPRSGATSINDYIGRLDQPEIPPETGPLLRLLRATSRRPTRERFVVATGHAGARRRADRRVRLGGRARAAVVPVDAVRPARGPGAPASAARCSRRSLPPTASAIVRATATDSAQPISNALYARYGIVPRMPLLNLIGAARAARGVRAAAVGHRAGPVRRRSRAAAAVTATRAGRRRRRARSRAARRRPPGRPSVPARGGPRGWLYRGPTAPRSGYGYAARPAASGRSPSATRRCWPRSSAT